ncbi:MAG: efflux RND transporter periplasmic adaptor subunit [Patescibacteria group bacterium]|nr:efflux RND transporter periplasmic adaptor subunit [Patescibacteria group bacterium]
MKRKITVISVLLTLLLIGYFGYQAYKINSLQTVKAEKGEIISSVFASGKTKAEKETNLSFGITGKIVYLPIVKNQEVKKGQAVVSLDRNELEASLRQAQQDFVAAKAASDQYYDGHKNATESYDEKVKRTALDATQNKAYDQMVKAKEALNNSTLYSPFDGIVTEVNAQENEWKSIFDQKPIAVIVDPSTIYFEAEIDEEDIGKIKEGQVVLVTLDAYPGKQFEAKVSELDKKTIVKENGDTILAVKLVFSSDFKPVIGLNGDVQFILERKKDILILPKRAIKKKDGSNVVMVKYGIGIKAVQVKTGVSDARNIQIIKGITEADQVVLSSEIE